MWTMTFRRFVMSFVISVDLDWRRLAESEHIAQPSYARLQPRRPMIPPPVLGCKPRLDGDRIFTRHEAAGYVHVLMCVRTISCAMAPKSEIPERMSTGTRVMMSR